MAGIPPLAGFLAKFYVFAAAIKMAGTDGAYHWLYWLVGIGLLTSVFALYYYANVIKTMYFSASDSPYKLKFSAPALMVVHRPGGCLPFRTLSRAGHEIRVQYSGFAGFYR